MSGWIKLEKDLAGDPRVRRIARQLRNAHVTQERNNDVTHQFGDGVFVAIVLGGLAQLWCYADTHIRDDDTIELGVDEINEVVGIQGFAQILPEDWLQILDADTVKLPGFHTHNGTDARKKALTQKRVSRHREKVTLESFKSERNGNASVTLHALPDQDQDQDQDQDKKRHKTHGKRAECDEFIRLKAIFPPRAGSHRWQDAEHAVNARLAEGHTWREILDGAERYGRFVKASGSERTSYVQQAATFVGPNKGFLEPWHLPATKSENHRDANIESSKEWLHAS